jgi:uncharacterized lipoprotein YddW (UPF0748 family)
MRLTRAIALALLVPFLASRAAAGGVTPPSAPREFRGVWVATVGKLDWPSRRDLTTKRQQAEMMALFDLAVGLHLNAVIFQVRPMADALYESRLEPWSEYLTGTLGKAPEPRYEMKPCGCTSSAIRRPACGSRGFVRRTGLGP